MRYYNIITELKNALDIYAYCVCENVLPYFAISYSTYRRGYIPKAVRNISGEMFKKWKIPVDLSMFI